MEEAKRIVQEVIEKQNSDKVLLSFSCGKDAWATWCAIKDICDVHPFIYCADYDVERLKDYFAYSERKIGKHIVVLPPPNLYDVLNHKGLIDQPPHRIAMLEYLNLPRFTFEDVQRVAAIAWGLPETTFTALGVRAADSARRAMHFRKHGAITDNKKKFYPIWHWKKDELMDALIRENVKLPPDYELFGRSFDGEYYLFTKVYRKQFPAMWERIKEIMPLIELDFYRHEKRQEKHNF